MTRFMCFDNSMCVRVLDLLKASYLRHKKVVADMVVGSVQSWVGLSP